MLRDREERNVQPPIAKTSKLKTSGYQMSLARVLCLSLSFVGISISAALTSAAPVNLSPSVNQACPAGIEIVVGFAAGSVTDIFARNIAQRFTLDTSLPAVVINKPGASGLLAVDYMQTKSSCALMITTASTWVVGPTIMNSKVDPSKVLQPVAMLGASPFVLVVSKNLGVTNLADFFERAKRDDLSYTSAGIGTAVHLPVEILLRRLGIKAVHLPMKGTPEALSYVIGGHAQFTLTGPSLALGPLEANQVVALGASSKTSFSAGRFTWQPIQSALPEGLDLSSTLWIGLTAAPSMPPALVQEFNGLIRSYLNDPTLISKMRDQGYELDPMTVDQFAKFLDAEHVYWKNAIHDIGVESLR